MKFIEVFESNISASTTLCAIAQLVLYVIGLVINIKIIFSCWKNKDHNKSWQLHILYSVSCIIIYAFNIPFWLVSKGVPHLSHFTGESICYLALFFNKFFMSIIIMSSLMVAITKYIFVVHWDKALAYGHEKIQWTMFTISLLVALPIAFLKTALKRYDDIIGSMLQSCVGFEHEDSGKKNAWDDISFFWCTSENIAPKEDWGYAYVVLLQIICVVTHALYGIIFCNIPEAFFYYKIFKKMNR